MSVIANNNLIYFLNNIVEGGITKISVLGFEQSYCDFSIAVRNVLHFRALGCPFQDDWRPRTPILKLLNFRRLSSISMVLKKQKPL